MTVAGIIDRPEPDALVYQHGFEVAGWAPEYNGLGWTSIDVFAENTLVGSTALRYARPDVEPAMGANAVSSGFTIYCTIPDSLRTGPALSVDVIATYGDVEHVLIGQRVVRLSGIDYRMHGHGDIVREGWSSVMVRDQVYGSGPPAPLADPLVVDLVMRYLRSGESLLDVGCGIGAFARPLASSGLQWMGVESRPDFVARMEAAGLDAVCSPDGLPFADASFDATICIEVLEHVAEYERFLAEVSRVSKRVSIFSVPNFAAIPVTSSFYALPWHMLESDHKNFFTTRSLKTLLERFYAHVETFEYGPLPLLKSMDGLPVNNHVFAVASHGRG